MMKSFGIVALLRAACAIGTDGPPRRETGGAPGRVAPEVRRGLFE